MLSMRIILKDLHLLDRNSRPAPSDSDRPATLAVSAEASRNHEVLDERRKCWMIRGNDWNVPSPPTAPVGCAPD